MKNGGIPEDLLKRCFSRYLEAFAREGKGEESRCGSITPLQMWNHLVHNVSLGENEAHLSGCEACQATLNSLRETYQEDFPALHAN